jgi:hypothetical protein
MRSFTPWLLLVVAALAVSSVLRPSAETKPADASNKTATANPEAVKTPSPEQAPKAPPPELACKPAPDKTPQPWCEPLRIIRDFFGLDPGVEMSKDGSFNQVVGAARDTGYSLRFFVALVPDPIDAYPPFSFDMALDAIQQGFSSAQYQPDRVWLPWTLETGKPSQGTAERLYRTTPGVLLFRHPAAGELAVVFLVGESPKTGIQKRAFNTALQIVSDLRAVTKKPEALNTSQAPEVGILGPSFSGSAASLSLVIATWSSQSPSKDLYFKIASGSATAYGLEQKLPNFCRTVVPDEELQEIGFQFLRDQLGWNLDQMAILTEADTAYGQGAACGGKGANCKELEKGKKDPELPSPILIRFPSRISDVRSAWEQNAKATPGGESTVKVGRSRIVAGRPALDLSLEDRDLAVDQVPNFSFLTTPAKDLELSNVLQTISREGIRYVGVLATDLKDRMFLIGKIRQYAPDTVVFTFDNDLLLAHPQYGIDMDGVVVLSSTPLFAEGAPWLPKSVTFEERQPWRQQFMSEFQQGPFEAVRHLLGVLPPSRPQVWISVVGNGSLWPLAHREVGKESKEDPTCFCGSRPELRSKAGSQRATGGIWLAGKANLGLLTFAGALCLLSIGLQKIGLLKGRAQGGKSFVFFPVNRALILCGSSLLVLFAGLLLAIGSLPEWAPCLSGVSQAPWPLSARPWRWLLFLCALVLAYGYLAFQLLQAARGRVSDLGRSALRVLRRRGGELGLFQLFWAKRGLRDVWSSGLWLGAFGVLVSLFLTLSVLMLWVPNSDVELFQLRVRTLGSGLSPLLSLALLLGALFVWILCELRRRWLVQRQSADCPLYTLREGSFAGCDEILKTLHAWMDPIFPRKRWPWIFLTSLLIPPLVLLWGTMQPIVDTKAYGRVFLVLLWAVCFLTLLTFLRFVTIWLNLEPILRRINHASPELKKTLKELSPEVDWKPMRSFAFQIPAFKMLVLSVQKLSALIDARRLQAPKLDSLLKDVFQSDAEGLSLDEWCYRRQLEAAFKAACDELDGHIDLPGAREFLALRVVAYLRYVFGHLRNCLMSAVGMGLLTLVGVTAYAFQPKQLVSSAVWLTLAAGVALTFWIFLQMDRNPALSLISGTNPGEITLDKTFWANFTLYVVIPVLSLIATQFPEVGRLLGQMTDQLLRVAGGG